MTLPCPVVDFSCIFVCHRKKEQKNLHLKVYPEHRSFVDSYKTPLFLPLSGGAVVLWRHFLFFLWGPRVRSSGAFLFLPSRHPFLIGSEMHNQKVADKKGARQKRGQTTQGAPPEAILSRRTTKGLCEEKSEKAVPFARSLFLALNRKKKSTGRKKGKKRSLIDFSFSLFQANKEGKGACRCASGPDNRSSACSRVNRQAQSASLVAANAVAQSSARATTPRVSMCVI